MVDYTYTGLHGELQNHQPTYILLNLRGRAGEYGNSNGNGNGKKLGGYMDGRFFSYGGREMGHRRWVKDCCVGDGMLW